MIGCYLDESFDPNQKGIFATGGLLGRGVPFFELERKWEKLRKRPDINITYFKSSECQRGSGEFQTFVRDPKTITEAERKKLDAMRDEFLDLIAAESVVCFGIGVVQDDFYEVIRDDTAKAILSDSPYWFAYQAAMIEAAFAMKTLTTGDSVAFVCDEHERYSPLAHDVYLELKNKNPNAARHMGSFSSVDDLNCAPLQAADSVVFEIRRAFHVSLGQRQEPVRQQFNRLSKCMWLMQYADKKYLQSVIEENKPREPLNLDHFLEQEFHEDIKF